MGVRKESVELSLADVGYTTGMAKAAAETAVLNRELDKLDGSSVKANKSTSTLADQGIKKTGDSSKKASGDLEQFTGKMNLLGKSAITLGPALLPIGATAVPAIAGLTAGLGAAAGAVGTALLAFHGLGDGLKALNTYELSPTAANFQKFKDTMAGLSPASEELVFRLKGLEQPLHNLQAVAANGLFPGVNQALNSLVTLGPQVRAIVGEIATEMGGLAASGGRSLANDADWRRFFEYMRTDARPILDSFAKAIGNFTAGFASMMVAFQPLADQFAVNLKHTSETFRDWAAGLGDNPSFQHFVDYIRENGPKVKAFFESIGDALGALAHAAAPWASIVLPILTDVANVFAAIANSPIGPTLFEAAAAGLLFGKIGGPIEKAAKSLSLFSTNMKTARAETAMIGPITKQSAQTLESFRSGLIRAGAGAVGIGLIAASADHANTRLGELGTVAGYAAAGFAVGGPWGAAIGGAAGLLTTLTNQSDKANASLTNLTSTLTANGAATSATYAGVASELQSSGLIDVFSKMGVSTDQATKAIIQNGTQFDQLWAKVRAFRSNYTADDQARAEKMGVVTEEGTKYAEMLGQIRNSLVQNTQETTTAANAAETFAAKQAEAAAQLKATQKAAADAGNQFGGFGADVNNAKVSLSQFLQQMEDRAKAITDFGNNAATAAKRGLSQGLILELAKMGQEGALRMQQLANASDKELSRASRDWDNQNKAIEGYQALIQNLPTPKIKIDNSEALSAIGHVMDSLLGFSNQHPTVKLNVTNGKLPTLAGILGTGSADGATVPKTGLPYADRHPYMLADGEEVISNRFGQADRNRPLLKAINAGYLADGGTAKANRAAAAYGIHITDGQSIEAQITAFTHALDRATGSLQNETQARDTLISTVKSNLTGSLFNQSSSGSVFSSSYASGSLGSVNAELRKETNDARLQTKLEKNLRGRGLSGAALQDLITNGGLPALQQFAAGSNADLKTYQHLYSLRGTAINEAAGTASSVLGLSAAVNTTNAQLVAIKNEIQQLRNDQKGANRAAAQARKNAAAKHAAATAAALNHVAKKGKAF